MNLRSFGLAGGTFGIRCSVLLGVATLGAGLALADPVPIRPLKPRSSAPKPDAKPAAKAAQLPRCQLSQRGVQPNGPDFTGTGIAQNPPCAPLPQLQFVKLTSGIALDGKTVVKDFAFIDGELKSASQPAASLVGATLLGEGEGGRAVRLRIESVETAADPDLKTPSNENADVRLYRIVVQQGQGSDPSDAQFHPNVAPTGSFSPLCEGGKLAIAVPGSWDYHVGDGGAGGKSSKDGKQLTFACVGSAIAKCVMVMKYKPWRSVVPEGAKPGAPQSLDELHQACVRAVRADYCGDGESMTQVGEQVNFYDRIGIERDSSDWPLEAAWSPAGALCVNTTRLTTAPENLRSERAAMRVIDYIKQHCPSRLESKPCDQAALTAKGAVLWTEVAPKTAPQALPPKTRN